MVRGAANCWRFANNWQSKNEETMQTIDTDVAIIGSGTAGMSAYRAARHHTERVVLIESGQYGTTCARVGCMPSKLLIAAADSAHGVRQAPLFGVHTGPVRIDGAQVMQRVRSERDRFVGFVLDAVEGWPAADKVHGHAQFVAPNELRVDDHTQVLAKRVVIATGSAPYIPDGWREALGERLIINDDVFDWQTLPESVAVVGGGVIALELAQALDRLGVRVRLLTRDHKLGPLTDPALCAKALSIFTHEMSVVEDAGAIRLSRGGRQAQVTYADAGVEHTESFDFVLAAMGRRPRLEGLNLHAAGIELDALGFPPVDRETGQIAESTVFIAGDVSNKHPLLHEGADDGRIAGDNAGRFPDVRVRPRRAPLAIVFTDPQIMIAGASFRSLQAAGTKFETGRVSFEDQGRSRVIAQNSGLLHVYGAYHTGRFLGAEMIGPAAEHIGHLLSWAVQHQLSVQQMLDSPFYHPVIEEGVRTALRELNRRLRLGPVPVEQCLDCGPGG
jgi:dihydrolipoamide dehydrogenase